LGSLRALVCSPAAWALALAWALPQAVWNNWVALMVISLAGLGRDGGQQSLSETWVNVLGIVAVLVSAVVSILVGMANDMIKGQLKATILGLLSSGGLVFGLLSLICLKVIVPHSFLFLQVAIQNEKYFCPSFQFLRLFTLRN
jgi:hypothetical protein